MLREKISLSTHSSIKIVGLLKKNYDDDSNDTEFVKLRVSGFSCRALEAHTTLFGMWIAGYWPVSDFGLVLKAWVGVLAEILGSFYTDHVRFDLCYPY